MKKIIYLFIVFSLAFTDNLKAQKEIVNGLFQTFLNYYNAGDLIKSENTLLLILDSKVSFPDEYKVAIYNNLGATYILLGRYKDALDSYGKAETLTLKNQLISHSIADIYINKAIIYGLQKSYSSAFEYFEKGIRTYIKIDSNDKKVFSSLSSAYLNIGLNYLELRNFKLALDYFRKSEDLKLKYRFSGLALTYLDIAKVFVKTGNQRKAEEYFLKLKIIRTPYNILIKALNLN